MFGMHIISVKETSIEGFSQFTILRDQGAFIPRLNVVMLRWQR